jgi:hypothetical protein
MRGDRGAGEDLLTSPELWEAVAVGAAATGAAAIALARAPQQSLRWLDTGVLLAGTVMVALLLRGHLSPFALVAVGAGIAIARAGDLGRLPVGAAAVSMLCAAATYGCVPDTEAALTVLGATVGVGAVAEATRLKWGPAAAVVTTALAWVALVDGSPRTSALVGGLAIAAVHGVGVLALRSRPSLAWAVPFAVLVVAAAWWCSRVAGLSDSGAAAAVLAFPALAGVVVAAVGVVRHASSPRSAP